MDSFLLIKMAYDEEMSALEKEALLKFLPSAFKWGLNKFKGIGDVVRKSFSSAETAGSKALSGAESTAEKVVGAGKPAAGATTEAAKEIPLWKNFASLTGFGPTTKGTWGYTLGAPLRPFFGGEGAGTVMGFGLFGGGLNAAMADPGERMSAFAKGFGSGLAGGAGWEWGGKLGKGIVGRLAKPGAPGLRGNIAKVTDPKAGLDTYGKIMEYGKGQLPGLLGAKTLAGTIGMGSALGSSMLLQHEAEKHVPFLNPEQGVPPGIQAGAKAVGSAFGVPGMGLTAPQMSYMNHPGANPYGTI